MEEFAKKASDATAFLKQLSNEKRLMILCKLIDAKEMSVAEIADQVNLGQSALSQHLALLRESQLVAFRREGATLYYFVANPNVGRILKSLKAIFC